MQSFMSDMGVQANVTGPSAYQGQSAGYYSMGSVWSRFPQKNIQPFNIQLPHARAGCGGIDLFAGSFSFINTAELVAMLKATANNALGFAFKLAIDTISPEIGKVMDELAQKVQQMNQMNISSCETAQALVGGLWPKSDTASSVICEAIANSQGAVADWARARQQCNNGGQREALTTDPHGNGAGRRIGAATFIHPAALTEYGEADDAMVLPDDAGVILVHQETVDRNTSKLLISRLDLHDGTTPWTVTLPPGEVLLGHREGDLVIVAVRLFRHRQSVVLGLDWHDGAERWRYAM